MTRMLARLTAHWQLKLLSLVFATAFWAFVGSEEWEEAVYHAPVEFVEVPPGLTVASAGRRGVEVWLGGPRALLARVQEQDLRAEVSLRDHGLGEFVAWVAPADVKVPRGVRIIRVTPSRIPGTLEADTSREPR